ncbi:hypothetical protein JJB11_12495 [Ramlibacter ginsenosidimutans]|uniref:Tetratricopeptide repeat protein n=1 Tax=Ramlibacter ginsenosidimutans TaxID=502333 RepID=A0A934TSV4_9BURK|nr:hypothetical protein [Ramlibacter ginsenosidimutans]MBK6006912.1 hypothetical protein [Ramlibacter ginsenosidimutans]
MDQDTRFDGLISEGLAASSGQQRQAAIDLFTRASALRPASGIPHFLIGSEHAAAGDLQAAESAFANAVLLAPGFELARYQLGLLQFSAGRAAIALVTWQPLFGLGRQASLGRFVRAFAALAQDGLQEALALFEAGLACDDLNLTVASDVRQVTAGLRALLSSPGESAPRGEAHVLLAAYARGLH